MKIGIRFLAFVAIVGLFIILAMTLYTKPAKSHSWYDGYCCNENDCRQTILGEVERHADGWFVVPTKELIGFDDDRIRRSLDPIVHRCVKPGGATRCLYVPEMSG